MIRTAVFTLSISLTLTSMGMAQETILRFQWKPNQLLTYRVEHTTSATDQVGTNKTTTTSKLNVTKRWQVVSVDATGIATLQLTLVSLRLETTTPDNKVLLFDSVNPDASNPQIREQLAKYVGVPLVTLRVNQYGQVVEVKECKFGPASRFDSEIPFALVVPAAAPAPGQSWERSYRITLEPPQGTGEKFDASQRYTLKGINNGLATVMMKTTLKTKPEAVADQIPLLQYLPEGEITFDTHSGLLRRSRLTVNQRLANHQGDGSSYEFQSSYTEEHVPKQ